MKKTINNYLIEILEIVGDNYIHVEHGDFKYYTSGDYIVIYQLKGKCIQIASHRAYEKNPVDVTFTLDGDAPTKEYILNTVKNAYKTIKKVSSEDFKKDRLERLKELKQEIKDLKDKIKGEK